MRTQRKSPYLRLTRWLWTAAGVALLVTALTFLFVPPMPPRTLVMATGPEGGAYAALGQKYKEILRRQNLRLELLATNGSVENIERLRDSQGGVSVAFVQGGTTSAAEAPELVSLGTLFYEPFWVFSRVPPQNLPGGKTRSGMRVSFGPAGSGTNKIAHELAAAVGVGAGPIAKLHGVVEQESADNRRIPRRDDADQIQVAL